MEMNFVPGLLADRIPENGPGPIGPQYPDGGQASPNATKKQRTMMVIIAALFIFWILGKNNYYTV
jgi:hypothetical protein